MKAFARELMETIHVLENYPLKSYSELAKIIGISTQTFIRRVEELKAKDIIREVHSSLNPESMQLEKYFVIFTVSSLEGLKLLELACDIYPYTSVRNRIFGHEYGLYTAYAIPKGSFNIFESYLKFLLQRKYCKEYIVYKSEGTRISYPQPFYNNIVDIDEFDIERFFSKGILKKYKEILGRETMSPSPEFHPIQLLIMRDITTNMRTPIIELLEKYKGYLKIPKEKETHFSLPKGFRPFIKDFFSEDRTENAIYIDFKKKYHLITENHVENYWMGVNRKYFEMFDRFVYFVHNISPDKKINIFGLFREKRPPFNIHVEGFCKDIAISMSLPPYYHTKFAYFMKDTFENFSYYLLDTFEYNSVKYRFFVHNYNFQKQKWKQDRDWMLTNVVEGIDRESSRGKFRSMSNIVG